MNTAILLYILISDLENALLSVRKSLINIAAAIKSEPK
jgi:hypothetical protein